MKRNTAIEAVVVPVITGLGYEFVGLEYLSQGKHSVLRIYIDKPNGVNIDDCATVSRQLGSVLDVEAQFTRGSYNLEVSSPGVDRKIFSYEQFPDFVGKKIQVTVQTPVDGQRKFKGTLNAANEQELCLDVDGKIFNIECDNIVHANVVA